MSLHVQSLTTSLPPRQTPQAELLSELIKFETVSALGPSNGEYTRCAHYILSYMKDCIPNSFLIGDGKAPVVVAEWTGEDESLGPILLNCHYDVVPAGDLTAWDKCEPFGGEIKEGKVWGRGAQDMKCVVAQYMLALKRLAGDGSFKPLRTIIFTAVPDEEIGGAGMADFLASGENGQNYNVERWRGAEGILTYQLMYPPRSSRRSSPLARCRLLQGRCDWEDGRHRARFRRGACERGRKLLGLLRRETSMVDRGYGQGQHGTREQIHRADSNGADYQNQPEGAGLQEGAEEPPPRSRIARRLLPRGGSCQEEDPRRRDQPKHHDNAGRGGRGERIIGQERHPPRCKGNLRYQNLTPYETGRNEGET